MVLLVRREIPQLDGLVRACRGQGLAVRDKGHGANAIGVALEGGAFLAGGGIPELDGFVLAGGGQGLTVGGEGHGSDVISMAVEGGAFLTGGGIPELDGLVRACRGQCLAVGGKGHGANAIGVTLEGGAFLAGGGIPELDGFVLAGGGQGLTVGGRRPRKSRNQYGREGWRVPGRKAVSQSLMVSPLVEARVCPSGAKATEEMLSVWPSRVAVS